MTSKYTVPIFIETTASKFIGTVTVESLEEVDDAADKLWESLDYEAPTTYHCNNFDLNDWQVAESNNSDLELIK